MENAGEHSEALASITCSWAHDGFLCWGPYVSIYFHRSLTRGNVGPPSSGHREAMLSDIKHREEGTSRASKHF